MAKVKKPIEVGHVVKWTRRNGVPAKGMVVEIYEGTPSGKWVHVDTATKGQPPVISKVREATLTKG